MLIRCCNPRCKRLILDHDDDGQAAPSGERFPTVLTPPEGCIVLPDGDPDHPERDLLCSACASAEQIVEYMAEAGDVTDALAQVARDVAMDAAGLPRASEDPMLGDLGPDPG